MFRLLALLVCVAGCIGSPLNGRIVGGQDAYEGEFPHQISMKFASNGQHTCGGSIIDAMFILTAAHCVKNLKSIDEIFITVGSNDVTGGAAYQVAGIAYNGNFNFQNFVDDIALVKLASPIQFSSLVQPIQIIRSQVPDGQMMTLSGWGLLRYPPDQSAFPRNLQKISLQKISTNVCNSAGLPLPVSDNQICSQSPANHGACQGDSGGPLIYNGQLCGIVSWGVPCAKGAPDVFTNAAAYQYWIDQTKMDMNNQYFTGIQAVY